MRAKDVDLLVKEYPEAPKGDKKDEQLTEQFLHGSPRFRAAYEDIKSSLSKQSFDHIIVICGYPVVAEWLHKLLKHNKTKSAILDNKTTSVQRHTEISKHLKEAVDVLLWPFAFDAAKLAKQPIRAQVLCLHPRFYDDGDPDQFVRCATKESKLQVQIYDMPGCTCG
jgi:hypothetical protein